MNETDLFNAVFWIPGVLLVGLLVLRLIPKKRRRLPPSGSALQKQPEAVWARWDSEIGSALKR